MKLSSRSGRHAAKIELQMTSMIDVVFLLLIFFMVTSSFRETERELDPAVKIERQSGAQAADLAPTIIRIVRSGGGDFVYQLGGRELRDQAELTQVLSQLENQAEGAFVRAADDAPLDMAMSAIQAAKSARYRTVTYQPPDA
ncbi:MAG: biopolymer transporter ExbD [Pirellulaceae bacterium]|jgi:biopolymer transport protein ExbD|nr:biopolymer transporter ExbD [Pirellulaceae bacterium]